MEVVSVWSIIDTRHEWCSMFGANWNGWYVTPKIPVALISIKVFGSGGGDLPNTDDLRIIHRISGFGWLLIVQNATAKIGVWLALDCYRLPRIVREPLRSYLY